MIKILEMIRKIRDNNFNKTKDMSVEEQIALIQEKSQKLIKKSAIKVKPVKNGSQFKEIKS